VAGLAATLLLSGCAGGGSARVPPVPVPDARSAAGFDDIVAAVDQARIAWCPPAEGGSFVALPPPPAEAAAAAPYFRYLEGRIYQFGPCEVPPGSRNELRVFRYHDADVRDAAIREMAKRNSRPTAAFAVGDTFDAEIWSPDPSLEGALGRTAAAVHSALGRLNGARHLDVGP
jgi:hypothetical protein